MYKFESNIEQSLYRFDNGYGASVVRIFIQGFKIPRKYELCVIKWNDYGYNLCYDTPIAGDVIFGLSKEQVEDILGKIEKL